jgi:hypothetical protein
VYMPETAISTNDAGPLASSNGLARRSHDVDDVDAHDVRPARRAGVFDLPNRASRCYGRLRFAPLEDRTGDRTVSPRSRVSLVSLRSTVRFPHGAAAVNGPGRDRSCDLGVKRRPRQPLPGSLI